MLGVYGNRIDQDWLSSSHRWWGRQLRASVCMRACMHARMCVRVCTIHTYTYTQIHVYVYIYVYIYTYTHVICEKTKQKEVPGGGGDALWDLGSSEEANTQQWERSTLQGAACVEASEQVSPVTEQSPHREFAGKREGGSPECRWIKAWESLKLY